MNVIVISSSPNKDGLTAACATAAVEGVRQAGGYAESARLNDMEIGLCDACDDGWGTCLPDHACQIEDGFQALHARVCDADFDLIPVNRWSRDYKLVAIREAAHAMVREGMS